MMGSPDIRCFRPMDREALERSITELVSEVCGRLMTQLEAAQELNCRQLERAEKAEARLAELEVESNKVPDLLDRLEGKSAAMDTLRQYADGLVKRAQSSEARLAELEARSQLRSNHDEPLHPDGASSSTSASRDRSTKHERHQQIRTD